MRVLGIESSCDETAAAVVTDDGTVLADVVASQIAIHGPYGGVVPELAARAHLSNVLVVIEAALAKVDGGLDAIDAIAVTRGPGLVGALLVGLQAAQAIAFVRGLPIVGVDHLIGHLFAVFLRRDDRPVPALPYIALLVSGGHTAIYEVTAPGHAHILGQTRDDAAGEAFDKVAKLLGLGYPGGPIVDRLAQTGDPKAIALPRPMSSRRSLDFSFSGLKTAVARWVAEHGVPEGSQLADLCASFQHAAVSVLVRKSLAACEQRRIPRLVLGGGVAANRGLRALAETAGAKHGVEVFVPPVASCTDNAAMIAYAGALRLAAGERDPLALSPYSRNADLVRGKLPRHR